MAPWLEYEEKKPAARDRQSLLIESYRAVSCGAHRTHKTHAVRGVFSCLHWCAVPLLSLFALNLIAAPVSAATATANMNKATTRSATGHTSARSNKKTSRGERSKQQRPASGKHSSADSQQADNGLYLQGEASYYANKFQGRRTANGEVFDQKLLTAASNRYRLGSWVVVWRPDNGHCVEVKINDRMHSRHRRRIIDLTYRAATHLNMIGRGIVPVHVVPSSAQGCRRFDPTLAKSLSGRPEAEVAMPETTALEQDIAPEEMLLLHELMQGKIDAIEQTIAVEAEPPPAEPASTSSSSLSSPADVYDFWRNSP